MKNAGTVQNGNQRVTPSCVRRCTQASTRSAATRCRCCAAICIGSDVRPGSGLQQGGENAVASLRKDVRLKARSAVRPCVFETARALRALALLHRLHWTQHCVEAADSKARVQPHRPCNARHTSFGTGVGAAATGAVKRHGGGWFGIDGKEEGQDKSSGTRRAQTHTQPRLKTARHRIGTASSPCRAQQRPGRQP